MDALFSIVMQTTYFDLCIHNEEEYFLHGMKHEQWADYGEHDNIRMRISWEDGISGYIFKEMAESEGEFKKTTT